MTRRGLLILVLAYGLLSALSWAFDVDPLDGEDVIKTEYCPMWEIWHDQKAAGIPIEKRNGWPDQGGRYFEECDQ